MRRSIPGYRRFSARCVALCLVIAATNPTRAQAPEEVSAWFREEWKAAADPLAFNGFALSFHIEYPARFTDAELALLRAEAEGKPDHPNWSEIRAEEQRRRQPADASRHTIWSDGRGRWRYSHSYLDSVSDTPAFVDSTVAGDAMWRMTRESLHVASTGLGTSTPNFGDPRTSLGTIRWHLRALLFGFLGEASAAGVAPEAGVELDSAGEWTIHAGAPGIARSRFEGRWDPDAHRGFVSRVTIVDQPPDLQGSVGVRFLLDGWRFDADAGRWIAGSVTEVRPDGVVDHRLVTGDASPVSPEEFERLVAMPPMTGEDPVRGAVSFTSLYDHRPGTRKRFDIAPDRSTTGATDLPGARSYRAWRLGGWLTAAALVALFVVLRIRRSHT